MTESSLENSDGLIQVIKNQIKVTRPQGNGKWPVIVPGRHVRLFYDGQEIKSAKVIVNSSLLEVELINEPPESKFELIVSEDQTEVRLKTEIKPGKQYGLVDVEPKQKMTIQAELLKTTIWPRPIDSSLVYSQLAQMGITVSIDNSKIEEACNAKENSETVIAQGRSVIPPQDGYIDYVCSFQKRVRSSGDEDKDRIDYYDRGKINSIEAGTVLAYRQPPTPGKPGKSVHGKIIEPPSPKTPTFNIGTGVELIDDGKIAVAAIDGRPVLSGKNKRLSVLPQLVVEKNVDLSTGHIDFKGDVLVFGDVTDGLRIKATGSVEIKGNAFQADIQADQNIIIHQKVIGGSIQAGGNHTVSMQICSILDRFNRQLQKLNAAVVQVKNDKEYSSSGRANERYIIKTIAEMQLPQIMKDIKTLNEYKQKILEQPDRFNKLEMLTQIDFSLTTLDSVHQLQKDCRQLYEQAQAEIDYKADVLVNYCQNTKIIASGNIVVTGELVYNSELNSGNNIEVHGDCRGSILSATHRISVGVLGTTSGVRTVAKVGRNGIVRGKLFYPNSWINIDNVRYQIQEVYRNIEFRFDGKEWQKYSINLN